MMNRKRNKYFFREKEIYRLRTEGIDINNSIGNQSLVELEEPIHNGYYAEWVLREDILRRDDAEFFQEALNACKERIWSKNPEFKHKNRKTKKWEISKPSMYKLKKQEYEALSPQAKKHFVESAKTTKYWRNGYSDKEYRCTLSYELVVNIYKAYITHRREHDNILYQMDAENEKMLYKAAGNNNPYGSRGGNPKWLRKHENKKTKLEAERQIIDVTKAYKSVTNKKDLLDL